MGANMQHKQASEDTVVQAQELGASAEYLDNAGTAKVAQGAWLTVRDQLMQLARENGALLAANRDCMLHYEQMSADLKELRAQNIDVRSQAIEAKAELAKLRKRIKKSPLLKTSKITTAGKTWVCLDGEKFGGKRARLLVDE